MIELILFAVYFLSVILSWSYANLAFSEGGIYQHTEVGIGEVLVTLCPIVNTFNCVISWIFYYPVDKKKLDYSKFFNVKK